MVANWITPGAKQNGNLVETPLSDPFVDAPLYAFNGCNSVITTPAMNLDAFSLSERGAERIYGLASDFCHPSRPRTALGTVREEWPGIALCNRIAEEDLPIAEALDYHGREIRTVDDVIATMRNLDSILPEDRALKHFNNLYRMVTEEIGRDLARHKWASPKWLARLDVIFANLYFFALHIWATSPQDCPLAWQPLFSARLRSDASLLAFLGKSKIPCGLAGMAAHIIYDLPLAVLETCAEFKCPILPGTKEYNDFQRINKILREQEVRVMLEWAGPLFKSLGEAIGNRHEDWAMDVIERKRSKSWRDAQYFARNITQGPDGDRLTPEATRYMGRLSQTSQTIGNVFLFGYPRLELA